MSEFEPFAAPGYGRTVVRPRPHLRPERTRIITTASRTRLENLTRDLFSHPYTDQPAAQGGRAEKPRVSRVNLFREPGAPATAGQPDGR